jgi:hypothetical protein
MTLPADLVLTLDVDWAPDFVIDDVASRLIEHRVKATWFVTHASPAVDRLRAQTGLFELGIHPNFLPRSSHGASIPDVLDACMQLVPGAAAMRTHDLHQSTTVFKHVCARTPVQIDVSLFLPDVQEAHPFSYNLGDRPIWRLPYVWEDDYEMAQAAPDWTLDRLLRGRGLRALDFHPIHVYLNSARFDRYAQLKARVPRLQDATASCVDAYVQQGAGTGTFFDQVVAHLRRAGTSRTISTVVADVTAGQAFTA